MGKKGKNIKIKQGVTRTPVTDDSEYSDILRNLGPNIIMSDYKVLGGTQISQASDDEDDITLSEHEWYMSLFMNTVIRNAMTNEEGHGSCDCRNIVQSKEPEASGSLKEQKNNAKAPCKSDEKLSVDHKNIVQSKEPEASGSLKEEKKNTKTPCIRDEKISDNRKNIVQSNESKASSSLKEQKNNAKAPCTSDEKISVDRKNIVQPNKYEASGSPKEQKNDAKVPCTSGEKISVDHKHDRKTDVQSNQPEASDSLTERKNNVKAEAKCISDEKMSIDNGSSKKSNASKTDEASKEQKQETKKEDDVSADKDNEAKILKKKLKKQRQKEKKMSEKVDTKENPKVVDETCAQETKNITPTASCLDKETKESKKDDSHESENSNDDEDDNQSENFDFAHNVPAFMSAAVKKSVKKPMIAKPEKENKKVTAPGSSKNSNGEEHNAMYNDNTDCQSENGDEEFTFVTGKRSKQHSISYQFCATKAIEFIMTNNMVLAIKYFSQALEHDPYQICHYVNRSFCYLRSNKYSLAIADAQHAIRNSNDTKVLIKAKILLAQAFCATKDYEHAERTLEECLSLTPQDAHLQRQLLRVRILELISLGFPERIAIWALKDSNSILDAIDTITKKYADSEEDYCDSNNTCIYDENEVYYSDDEDAVSNTLLMSQIAHELTVPNAI